VLVGRIDEAGAYTARLQLLTDRGFQMAGRIRRNIDPARPRMVTVMEAGAAVVPLTPENNKEIEVIARGDGSSGMVVEYVKAYHNVLAGDLLVTSGEEAILPTEINVGVVTEVRPDAKDPHRSTLVVRPHADLDSLREVFVVVPLGAGGQ
jgi:cell shape-determining protein MreC